MASPITRTLCFAACNWKQDAGCSACSIISKWTWWDDFMCIPFDSKFISRRANPAPRDAGAAGLLHWALGVNLANHDEPDARPAREALTGIGERLSRML